MAINDMVLQSDLIDQWKKFTELRAGLDYMIGSVISAIATLEANPNYASTGSQDEFDLVDLYKEKLGVNQVQNAEPVQKLGAGSQVGIKTIEKNFNDAENIEANL